MLRESSTTTATMFCCELSADTIIAGCHSNSKMSATHADCIPHTAHPRQVCNLGEASRSRLRTSMASPAENARISTGSSHLGHVDSSTNRPLAKTGLGYLKIN